MENCWICREPLVEGDAFHASADQIEVRVHRRCWSVFSLLVREALRSNDATPIRVGVQKLAKELSGSIVLVHRNFPNEQLPILVYLAHFEQPVPVPDIYAWLRENELKIDNPSLALLRLSKKGLVTTLKRDNARLALITEAGMREVSDYADSVA